jgi:hypothetical protein
MKNDLEQKISVAFDRTRHELLALILSQHEGKSDVVVDPTPDWMTATQLARYWQLVNAEGEPTTAGIMKWTKRSENEHPLPHACMGDLLRFKREEVDRWAQEEAARRKTEVGRRKLQLAS